MISDERVVLGLSIKRACKAAFSHHLAGSNPNQEETGMAEAKRSIQETTDQAQRMATMTLALQRARNAVKEELERQRVRIADVEAKGITERARGYLIAHPELVTEARPVVESWIARGVFGKRAQRQLACSNLNNSAQSRNPPNSRAQARGVRFGRKPALTVHQQQEALARRANGEALVEIAR
jgi:hypothetical protein